MSKYRYIVAAISIVNQIKRPDGSLSPLQPGGLPYALSGARLYTDRVLGVTTSGPDYGEYYGDYFERNSLDRSGIFETLPKTHRTLLSYAPDGSWSERSVYGDDYFDLQRQNTMTRAAMLLPFCSGETRGIYFDSGATEDIFSELESLRQAAPNARLMWEPPTFSSCDCSLGDLVTRQLRLFDLYSLNLREARCLFGFGEGEDPRPGITRLGIPCLLRLGERGSEWFDGSSFHFAPSIGAKAALDPTGCGNCSSAAALWACCEGFSGRDIAALANAAAGINARYAGPVPLFTEELRAEALAAAGK